MTPLGGPGTPSGDPRRAEMLSLARMRAAKPRSPQLESGAQDAWMTTYTDMVTLLLTLFVFLVGMSNLKKEAPERGAEAPELVLPTLPPPSAEDPPEPDTAEAETPPSPPVPPDLSWLIDRARELEEFVVAQDLKDQVRIERTERAILVQLRDGFLFPSARADLTPEGVALVRRLAEFLGRIPGELEVEGHTDPIPIATHRFPSNWELSAARAAAVARKLIDNGVPARRLRAIGYADTRPVASNATADGRAANRRVTLMILARAPAARPDGEGTAP